MRFDFHRLAKRVKTFANSPNVKSHGVKPSTVTKTCHFRGTTPSGHSLLDVLNDSQGHREEVLLAMTSLAYNFDFMSQSKSVCRSLERALGSRLKLRNSLGAFFFCLTFRFLLDANVTLQRRESHLRSSNTHTMATFAFLAARKVAEMFNSIKSKLCVSAIMLLLCNQMVCEFSKKFFFSSLSHSVFASSLSSSHWS
jgi:hypothetical protein